MRSNWTMGRLLPAATLLAWIGYAAMAAPAAAQMVGDLRYTRGYDLVPNPPVSSQPTTFMLYGIFPTGCGSIDEATVVDAEHVSIRLTSYASCDSMGGIWTQSFSLGMLAAGTHTLNITMTMDRPDSGQSVHQGTLTFGVDDSVSTPPPPPPPPPVVPPLLVGATTVPSPPTPADPVALTLHGFAPFACPVVSEATVIDTSHLALTLSPGSGCGNDTLSAWTTTFQLDPQREGHHGMDVAITLAGDSVVTHHLPVNFLVVNDRTGWDPPPSDSLEHVLSTSRPNPFVDESRFSVSVDDAVQANVAVFDINGRRVSTVFRGRLQPGTTELAWNGHHDDGSRAAAGVYFYRLEMKGRVVSRRLVLLRPQ